MHDTVFAQQIIVWLALWVVVYGAPAIVAAHLKISEYHILQDSIRKNMGIVRDNKDEN